MGVPTDLIDEVARLQARVIELEAANHQLRMQSDEHLVRRVAELGALQKVNNAANSSLQLDATLNLIAATVAEVTNSDVCSIYLFEDNRLVLRATVGLNPDAVGRATLRLGEGITGWTAQAGRPVALRDAWQDPRFRYNRELQEEGYSSMLSVPIIYFTVLPSLVGVINVQHKQPRDYSSEEINFLEMVAGQIAFAIENARLYEQTDQALQSRVEELTALRRISHAIALTRDPKEMLDVIVREATALSRADAAAIFQLEEEGARLRFIAGLGIEPEQGDGDELAIGEGLIGRAVDAGKPAWSSDLAADSPADSDRATLTPGFRALCCVPLGSREGTIGGLVLYSREPRSFTDDEVGLLQLFADETAIALENARLYDDAQRNLAIKSALLKEIHHRVGNNLTILASLLSLQARHAKSSEAAEPLRDSVARIRSMANVHQLLMGGQIGLTSFGALVKQIVDVATGVLVQPGQRVSFETNGQDTLFDSDEATTLALILTELASNAILHGLADQSAGRIEMSAQRVDGWATISVRDTGCGLPADFDLGASGHLGLGLEIVKTLAEKQLGGHFDLSNSDGCRALVRFPSRTPGAHAANGGGLGQG